MGGLIPLMLQPSASIAMARPYEPRVSRYTSTSSPVVRRLPKRNMALPRISRPEISYSGDERRVALDEVRVFYLKRQYKQCSTRAIHVLEDSRGLVSGIILFAMPKVESTIESTNCFNCQKSTPCVVLILRNNFWALEILTMN